MLMGQLPEDWTQTIDQRAKAAQLNGVPLRLTRQEAEVNLLGKPHNLASAGKVFGYRGTSLTRKRTPQGDEADGAAAGGLI